MGKEFYRDSNPFTLNEVIASIPPEYELAKTEFDRILYICVSPVMRAFPKRWEGKSMLFLYRKRGLAFLAE